VSGGRRGRALPDHLGRVPGRRAAPRRPAPYRALDELPYPDYSDFPWARYSTRIVSAITGRGCGACRFCSDITSTAGRTFRSRAAAAVVAEVDHQCGRYDARHVVIDGDGSHELDPATLRQAAQAGLVRLTTGLESGVTQESARIQAIRRWRPVTYTLRSRCGSRSVSWVTANRWGPGSTSCEYTLDPGIASITPGMRPTASCYCAAGARRHKQLTSLRCATTWRDIRERRGADGHSKVRNH